jgi:prepilin-type N-terminal cleavage/methylation domain-containing protein
MSGLRRRRLLADRRGMTLIELLIALIVFSAVMAGALGFIRGETRGLMRGTDRMNALQNLQYAADLLQDEIRVAGAGALDQQPFIVYAGPNAFAFNADYTSNVQGDVSAVYIDPDAPTGSVTALTPGSRITIPGTAFGYPDTSYLAAGGQNSPAETIILYFTPDSTTPRSDDYLLMRQVNNQPPELVARNLLRTGAAFFSYYRISAPPGASASIDSVPSSQLPWTHSVAIHLSPKDTGAAAQIDSIRAVLVTMTATNGQTGTAERRRSLTRLIRMPNAGLAQRNTCGDQPLLGTALTAALTTVNGAPAVALTWNQATDEAGGERDVIRYVLWRKHPTDPDWGDPYLSIPAGNPTYAYQDAAVVSGEQYQYALAAQDCTPSLSTLATSGTVVVP